MKKKIIIVVSVVAVLALMLGGVFLIDKNRMDNNKPVIFSTWGYDYAPPEVNPNNDSDLEFNLEEYVKNIQEYISISGENKTFNVSLTEDIYGTEVTEFKQSLEVEDVLGSILTDDRTFVTIIPMPDFLDNQSYYYQDGKLVAYKKDFMGIGGSVTYYFRNDEVVFAGESKIEEEMTFTSEKAEDILERANNIYEKFLNPKNQTVTIPVKEKEDLVITLRDGWMYEFSGKATEQWHYAIKFYKSDENKKMTLYSYANFFGVCGTGLETEELQLEDGNIANVGFYDGSEKWTFITFDISEDELVAQNEGLTLEESNEALNMFKTLKLIKTLPGNIAVTERSFIATVIEEEPSYLIVEPNDGEIEKQQSKTRKILIADGESGEYIRDYLYGLGRKVIITYDPIIQADTNTISGAEIDVDGYDDFEITVVKSEKVQKRKILNNRDLDKLNSDYELYYYGLDEVNVKVNNKEMTFENALREGYITLSGLLSKANRDGVERDSYDDGGSTRFHYENYTIIKYNTLDGNNDLYICPLGTSINDLNK